MVSDYSGNKAGFKGLDKEKIARIIAESSTAKWKAHIRESEEKLEARVCELKKEIAMLSDGQVRKAENDMDELIAELEGERIMDNVFVHIDMDAFYAAVEMRDDPKLRSVPMAVGDTSMLCTSNYHARKFGVRSGMPGYIALKLCPQLKMVGVNFTKYRKASKEVQEVFDEYDENLAMGSLDEAYMNITNHVRSRDGPRTFDRIRYKGDCVCRFPLVSENDPIGNTVPSEASEECSKCKKTRIAVSDQLTFGRSDGDIVNEIRFRVEQKTGLTCSAGIAANWMLAKICSDLNKPNGQYLLERDYATITNFVQELEVRKVSGIGPATEGTLKGIGIKKCRDFIKQRGILRLTFSAISYNWFMRVGLGIGNGACMVNEKQRQKNISNETSFSPTKDPETCMEILRRLCKELAETIKSNQIVGGKTLSLTLRKSTFERMTRSKQNVYLISTSNQMFNIASQLLFKELEDGRNEFRLFGVGLSKLQFSDEDNKPVNAATTTMLDTYFKQGRIENNLNQPETYYDGEISITKIENRQTKERVEVVSNENVTKPKVTDKKHNKPIIRGAMDRFVQKDMPIKCAGVRNQTSLDSFVTTLNKRKSEPELIIIIDDDKDEVEGLTISTSKKAKLC
uniref:DNA polymerase kappa n=1 Tax=Rhabditophanes sp. KR3021 TaxID=114890 RepID=A0AC35TM05_9BILA